MISKEDMSNDRTKDIMIHKQAKICVIRFICNNLNAINIINSIQELCHKGSGTSMREVLAIYDCRMYVNKGNEWTFQSVCKFNLNCNRLFERNQKYFVDAPDLPFDKDVLLLFEVVYVPNEGDSDTDFESLCDHINMMYLRFLGEILSNNGNEYGFYIFGKSENGNIGPIGDDFHKLRFFFRLCADDWNSHVLVRHCFTNGNNKKKEEKVIHFYKERDDDAESTYGGRIFPLIDITQNNYMTLVDNSNRSAENKAFYDTLDRFKDKISELLCKNNITMDNIEEYDQQDTLLDKLLYTSTVYYLMQDAGGNNGTEKKKKEIEDIITKRDFIHEKCVDYAQGILQLVENSLVHVVNSSIGGYGNFCVRIRKRSNVVSLNRQETTNPSTEDKNAEYFMEVYVTDRLFSYQDNWGIVQKFYDNIEKRLPIAVDDDEIECLKQVLGSKNSSDKKIRIEQMFGVGATEGVLQKYLCLPQNMAYHYGLQILDNVVFTGKGCLYVQSGKEKEGYYMTSEQADYKTIEMKWQQGTAYVIYLPLTVEPSSNISYMDSIAVNDDGSHDGVCVEEFPYSNWLESKIDAVKEWNGEEKERVINSAVEKACQEGMPRSIYIDCARYHKSVHWEIIAKLAFMLLSINNTVCDNVALINLSSKHEVIKMFRHFALFYNRSGENKHMQNKSVFFVDKEAEMDVIIRSPLSSMLKNMYISQIYGGINKRAMEVVEYFGGRRLS